LKKRLSFHENLGIDPLLSARIEREEKEAITTSALAASRSLNSMENTGTLSINILPYINRIYFLDRKIDNRKNSDDENSESKRRKKRADLAAEAALRRLSNDHTNKPATTLIHVNRHSIFIYFLIKFSLGRYINYTT
jgi:hypothetical protein